MKTAPVITAVMCVCSANAFQNGGGKIVRASLLSREMKPTTNLPTDEGRRSRRQFEPGTQNQQQQSNVYNDRQKITSLSVATLEGVESLESAERASLLSRVGVPNMGSGNLDSIKEVLSASLLITGNTVGSSMFVLPDAVAGVGMAAGSAIFFGLYVYNLISGLLLADVAINLHENSDCDVPSSFKEFVDTALKSEVAGTVMAGASLISNSCFLAFGTVHAGNLLVNSFPGLGLDPSLCAGAFAAMIAAFSVTQTNKGLESITNAAVMVLFSSFFSLLLPSLAHVNDPMGTLLASGTNQDGVAAATAAALPLILSSLSFQNIVPSITKLLDFDRTKSYFAIAVGSFIPMAMYMAWCFAAVGGGLDNSVANGAGAAAFTAFSASALVGSCVAAVMSLAEEVESIISSVVEDGEDSCTLHDTFSVPAVALSMISPVALALASAKGGDLTSALHFNGAFITPILYGLLPIVLYQSVQKKDDNAATSLLSIENLSLPQAILGVGTIGFLGQEIIQDLSTIPNIVA